MTFPGFRPSRAAAVLALVLGLTAPAAAPAQTLADALVAAYENSNLLEQNRALLRAADEDVAQAVAALRPVVNFVARAEATSVLTRQSAIPAGVPGGPRPARDVRTNDLQGSLAVSAELTVFDFGRNRLGIEAAKGTVLATRQALVGLEQRVLLNAAAAFMDVRAARANVDLREANVRLITQELRAARDRFEVGEITRTDVAIAEARLAGARSQLAAAQGELTVAREAYRAATGTEPGQLRAPSALPRLPANVDAAKAIARDRHPSIRQAQFEVEVGDLNLARAAAQRQGQVVGSANLTVDQDRRDRSSLSLSYSRPLYTGGQLPSLERQARAQRDASRSNLHQVTVEVLETVGRSWSDLVVASARIEASDRQIEAAQTAFEGVQQEAELGARTTLDVLNAEQELLDARAARISAETGRVVAVYAVLSSMGLLTVEHLNLGIPVYDPEAYYNAVRSAPVRSPQGEQLDRVLRRLQP